MHNLFDKVTFFWASVFLDTGQACNVSAMTQSNIPGADRKSSHFFIYYLDILQIYQGQTNLFEFSQDIIRKELKVRKNDFSLQWLLFIWSIYFYLFIDIILSRYSWYGFVGKDLLRCFRCNSFVAMVLLQWLRCNGFVAMVFASPIHQYLQMKLSSFLTTTFTKKYLPVVKDF